MAGESQLYQPEKPVVYIVPLAITFILGRLPLIPAGNHSTIPAEPRGRKRDIFQLGKCEDLRPGTDIRLFYISSESWMCWPTSHPKKPKT